MDNTFSTLISFQAADKWVEATKGYQVELWNILKDKVMPVTVAGALGAEALFVGGHELKLSYKTMSELVKSERSTKQENPFSGPKSFPMQVVGLTLTSGTAVIASGDQVPGFPFQYRMVLSPAKNTNPAQPQSYFEPGFYQPRTASIF